MITETIGDQTFFIHNVGEVAELARACAPMKQHIRAVSGHTERELLGHILHGKRFRRQDAYVVRQMLLRATKHARSTIGSFFPILHSDINAQADELENATDTYWRQFQLRERSLVPTF